MIVSTGIILLLAAAAAGVAAMARFLQRPIPGVALGGFLLVSILPYPAAFVSPNATPLPLDHAVLLRPWHVDGSAAPYNPYLNDIATQILPWAKAVRMAWKEGAWPLRDRWNGCGTPLAANSVSAAFSPLTFLSLLLPLARGYTLLIAIRLLLAASGMWLWVRELEVSPRASGFAATAFALSFTFVPPWIFFPQSSVFCLWPWMLFLMERCRDTRGLARAVGALAALLALIQLAGHPESASIGLLFAGLWFAGRWLAGDLADARPLAARVALAAAVAVGLTAFLLIPSLFAIAASNRLAVAARPYWQPLLSLLPHLPQWRGILPAFFPHTLGNAIGSPTVPGGTGTFVEMAMGYTGIVGWTAALFAFRPGSPRSRSEWVLWGLLLGGFGAAICLWPVAEIVARLPVIRYVFPLRFNAWVALAAPAIAAFELDRYAQDESAGRGTRTAAVMIPVLLGVCGAGLYAYLFNLRKITGGLPFQTRQLVVILAVLTFCALLALATRRRFGLYATGLTLVCGVELLYQWGQLNRLYSPALLYPETPLLSFLHSRPGTFRVVGEGPVLFPNTNVFAGLEDIRTHDAVERRDYMVFLDATCGYPYAEYFKQIQNDDASVLDFLNVRYLLCGPGGRVPGRRWRSVYSGPDGVVFENTRVLARAFAPARIRLVPPPAARPWPVLDSVAAFGEAFREIASMQDWSERAYILSEGAVERENPRIEISGYRESTNAVSLTVRVAPGRGPGFVVLSLVQDGGWSAREDGGAVVPTLLANGPFLAVRLPEGEHRVSLRYCPPGMCLGAAISAVTALAVVAAVALAGRRWR